MTAKLSDSDLTLRDAIFEHEMFESYSEGNASFGISHVMMVEATWAYSREQLLQAFEKMIDEGLVQLRGAGSWFATETGLVEREKAFRRKGKRHPSLSFEATDLKDKILALVRSAGRELEQSSAPRLSERRLNVFLYDVPADLREAAIMALRKEGLLARGPDFMDSNQVMLGLTVEGIRYYAQQVAPRLGLTPPSTILAPARQEDVLFEEMGLPEIQADNLRYRWQEAERCTQARAWLSASIMFGSILEVVLFGKLEKVEKSAMTSRAAPKDRKKNAPLPLSRWSLNDYIQVSAELGMIDKTLTGFANELRGTRNLIHPQLQIRERSNPDGNIAAISRHVVLAVVAALSRSSRT